MPIYEYKCHDCGKQIEKMQKVSDEPLTKCDSCGGTLEKIISLSGFQLKGGGWYKTDYAGSSTTSSSSSSEPSGNGAAEPAGKAGTE